MAIATRAAAGARDSTAAFAGKRRAPRRRPRRHVTRTRPCSQKTVAQESTASEENTNKGPNILVKKNARVQIFQLKGTRVHIGCFMFLRLQ
jgi:hypothetical protein